MYAGRLAGQEQSLVADASIPAIRDSTQSMVDLMVECPFEEARPSPQGRNLPSAAR
jgi:hypothetical protein